MEEVQGVHASEQSPLAREKGSGMTWELVVQIIVLVVVETACLGYLISEWHGRGQ